MPFTKKLTLIIFCIISIKLNAQICFGPHSDYATNTNPNAVVSGDFNNDGNNDIALTNGGDNNIIVYLGNGTGTFGASQNYTTTMVPQGMCTGYFNADAFLDIAFTNAGGSGINVLLNDGLGGFLSAVSYIGGSNPQTVTSGDFNGDGFIDLVGANYGSANITLFLGDGAGNFGTGTNFGAGTNPSGVICADLNSDSFLDVVTCNYGSNNISVLIGNGLGSFATRVNYAVGGVAPGGLVYADFDSDGDKDIAVGNMNSSFISVLFNTGSGIFSTASTFNAQANSLGPITTSDYNGDGNPDLAVAISFTNTVNIFLGNGLGSFATFIQFDTDFGPRSICSGDFNNDTKIDLATGNFSSNTMSVLLNTIPPVVHATATDTTICQNTAITLNGTGATTYTWSPAPATNGVSFTPIGTTTYTVTGTINGCTDTDTLTVYVLQQPTLFVNPSNFSVCIGSPATLTATGNAASYIWDNGVINGVPFYPTASMPYTVVATAANGCTKSTIALVSINPIPNAVIASGSGTSCTGTPYNLSSSGSSGGTLYAWRGPTTGALAGTTPNSAATNVLLSGTYTLTVTNSTTGCKDTATTTVNFLPLPNVTASASNTIVCPGSQVTLTGGGANTFVWTSGVNDGVAFTANASQTYTVTGTDANNCSKTASITITVTNPPTPQICMVTVDSLSNYNEIYWDKTLYPSADTFLIYRETTVNNYQIIGRVPYDSLSMFIDTTRTLYFPSTGNPNFASHKYKIAIVDTCNTLSTLSPYHKTIKVNDQLNGNFDWNHYEIEGQSMPIPNLISYELRRDNDLDGIFETNVGSLTGTNATDGQYFSFNTTADWRVFTNWNISCNPTLRVNGSDEIKFAAVRSRSNIKTQRVIGLNENKNLINFNVYPNPSNGFINLDLQRNLTDEATISVETLLGQTLYSFKTKNMSNKIDLSAYSNGTYLIKVKTSLGSSVKKVFIN